MWKYDIIKTGDIVEKNNDIRNDELKIAMITLKLQDDKASEDIFVEELKKAYKQAHPRASINH